MKRRSFGAAFCVEQVTAVASHATPCGMTHTFEHMGDLVGRIQSAKVKGRRKLVALAGPPASGKSTLASHLAKALGDAAQVVPMDGFHLDNSLLRQAGLLARKGAPQTFDAVGFVHLVRRLRDEGDVVFPTFDRDLDMAVAGTGRVTPRCDTVIIEGNYLLFDAPPWRALAPLWDISIRLDPALDLVRDRLVARWLDQGLAPDAALARAQDNDLDNARQMATAALPADITLD